MSIRDEILPKFRPRKKWGQNFLIDENIVRKILKEANITNKDLVLEIGAGKGILTCKIAQKAKKVIAVEIDKKLCAYLEDYLKTYKNVEVIQADFLKLNLYTIDRDLLKIKIIANLPYYITTPIIIKLLKERVWTEALLMVQKEVAERITASPGEKEYGRLNLIVSYFCDVKLVGSVSPKVFFPPPKVTSTIIKLTLREEPRVKVENEFFLFTIIKAAFSKRRKTLINNLLNFPGLNFKREDLSKIFSKLNIPVNIRGESLDIKQFAELSNVLCNFTPLEYPVDTIRIMDDIIPL